MAKLTKVQRVHLEDQVKEAVRVAITGVENEYSVEIQVMVYSITPDSEILAWDAIGDGE